MRAGEVELEEPRELRLRPDSSYLMRKGTRGFGLATARWLVSQGARSLVLASRSGRVALEDTSLLEAQGAQVRCVALDVSEGAAVEACVAGM